MSDQRNERKDKDQKPKPDRAEMYGRRVRVAIQAVANYFKRMLGRK